MKKVVNWLLMGALVVGLGMGVTSCKDDDDKDDDDGKTPENVTGDPMDTDEAQTAWRWLCALTDADSLDAGWAKKTYEPTIGTVSEQNAQTRIVVVSDVDEAKTNFANIADVTTDRLGSEVTVSQDGVGKLTWTPSPAGAQNLAEVEVDTKLIPHLSKIVYCLQEQTGLNGLFSENCDGIAYYRLGDVVYEKATKKYWVCVRPAFWQNDKGDSHWIHVFNQPIDGGLPQSNIYDKYNQVKKYDYHTIMLPTQLKYDRNHLNNFSNLIFALLERDLYAAKVSLKGFKNALGGFSYEFHGINFLKNVADCWSEPVANGNDIWKILFNRSYKQMANDLQELTFLYKGYQWRVGSTGYVWEFTAKRSDVFMRCTPGSESDDKKLYDFGGQGYDIRRYCSDPKANDLIEGSPRQFNDGHYYWVTEYKKGEDLMAQGKYSPYEALNGCDDIYVYNKKSGDQVHNEVIEDDSVKVFHPVINDPDKQDIREFYGRGEYSLGDVYRDENGHRWFVVNVAGRDDYNPKKLNPMKTTNEKEPVHEVYKDLEPSPYAELVTFDGLAVSENKQYITNLPTHDQALRGAMWLWSLFSSCVGKDNAELTIRPSTKIVLHIMNHTGKDSVDARNLFQVVKSKSGYARNHSQHASIGYRTVTANAQPLIRFLRPIDIDNEATPYRFHDHYVKKADYFTEDYRDYDFSDNIIYLQDVANQDKVEQYAKDFYATQPLINWSGGDGKTPRTSRKADPVAKDVSNFLYNCAKWRSFTYPLDMWNAPVLFFRMTRIYDRGSCDHATITVDGHTLTRVSRSDVFFYDKEVDEEGKVDDNYNTIYVTLNTLMACFTPEKTSNLLDGKVWHLPSWKTAWK